MFYLKVKGDFDAAHRIVGYDGKCNRLHGHTWLVEVTVQGTELDDLGMLVDFKILQKNLKLILERFDHFVLNEIEPFATVNPTAENLAKYIFEALKREVTLPKGASFLEAAVYESPHSVAIYREE